MAEQRVYNLVRKTEYRSMGKTTVEVSTFSSRAAANAAMWDFTNALKQELKQMKGQSGEKAEPHVETETDKKTGVIKGITLTLAFTDPAGPELLDHWEVVPTVVDEGVKYHGAAKEKAQSVDQLLNEFSETFAWMNQSAQQPGAEVKVTLPDPDDPNLSINVAIPKSADAKGMDDYTIVTVEKNGGDYYLYDQEDELIQTSREEQSIVKILQSYLNQD